MLSLTPSVQSPSAWDRVNLTRAGMRTRLADSGYRYKIHPAETTAGLVDADLTFGFDVGDIRRYGAVPDDTTDAWQAITNAIAVAVAGGLCVEIHGGPYVHSDTLDWSFDYLQVRCFGKAQLRHDPIAAGIANKIDGVAGSRTNIVIEGYLEELGGANTTIGWFIRGLYRSRLDIRAKNASLYGCQILFAVLCDIRYAITNNDVAISTQPTYGLVLNKRDPGEQVAECRFPNLFIEGLTNTGLLIASCFNCDFLDGSIEGCDVGVECSGSENVINTIVNFDFESNTTADVTVAGGTCLTFINCQSTSATAAANIALNGGDSTTFLGGFYRWINCVGGAATNSRFFALQIPNNLSVGITGAGSRKSVGIVRVDGSRVPDTSAGMAYYDEIGESGTFTPEIVGGTVAGAQSYAANGQKGYWRRTGRRVDFSIFLQLTANSGGTGNATITGLPFTSQNVTNGFQTICIGDYTGVTLGAAGRTLALRISPNGTTGLLLETDTGSVSNFIAIGAIGATAVLIISGSYLIE